jgi:benzoyl-CoA reductase/2-hydroxyglutaryl-CoA dehydratase subunit BcrC/BadD/HgdB
MTPVKPGVFEPGLKRSWRSSKGDDTMYNNFFSLCGFEPDEISNEAERIETAFGILGIGPDEVETAQSRVHRYFDVELLSIRKVLGIWLREMIDIVLAREEGKKVVYASMPPNYQFVAAMSSASDDIYCIIPETVLAVVLGTIFDKITPILEAAESAGMPPGNAFCSFLQARVGAISMGIIPKPDLVVPSCYICDHSPKADELLHEVYGVPVIYIDNPFEDRGDQWPEVIDPRRVQYIAREMEDAAERFGDLFGYPITEAKARQVMAEEAELFKAASSLYTVMKADPILISQKDLKIAQELASICSRRCMREGTPALQELKQELEKRVNRGVGRVDKGAPRILFSMTSFDPAITEMVEKLGLVISTTALSPPATAPIAGTVFGSVWEEIADNILRRRGTQYSSMATINQYAGLAKHYDVDGAILFHHIGCRQYCNWIPQGKVQIEKDLAIPVLALEGDFIDSREYSVNQMQNRVEAFSEVVKSTANRRRERGS